MEIIEILFLAVYGSCKIGSRLYRAEEKKINEIIRSTNIKNTCGSYPTVKRLNKTFYHLIIPYGISFDKVKQLEPIISTGLKKQIQINNDNFVYSITPVKPNYFPQLHPIELHSYKSNELKFPIGYDQNHNLIWVNFSKSPNLLLNGVVGSGKSVFIHNTLLQLLKNYSDIELTLIDMKVGIELFDYSELINVKDFTYEPDEVLQVLTNVYDTIHDRLKKIRSKGYRTIIEYNNHTNEKLPYHVVVFEELMAMKKDKKVMEMLKSCLSIGRASGVFFILTSQRFDSTVIDGAVKANNENRISFKVGNEVDSRVILDEQGAEKLPAKGRCLFSNSGTITEVQCFYVDTENELRKLINDFPKKETEVNYFEEIELSESEIYLY